MIQMGVNPMMVRALNAILLTSAFVSMGWIGRINSPERAAVLDFVAKCMNDDIAGDLVNDQQCHVISDEIIGGESIHIAFALAMLVHTAR